MLPLNLPSHMHELVTRASVRLDREATSCIHSQSLLQKCWVGDAAESLAGRDSSSIFMFGAHPRAVPLVLSPILLMKVT